MTGTEIVTLARLYAQDTNSAATHQPIGQSTYWDMVNATMRLHKAKLDTRPRFISGNASGLFGGASTVVKVAANTNIRRVVKGWFSTVSTPTDETSAGVIGLPAARWVPPHVIIDRIARASTDLTDEQCYSCEPVGSSTAADYGKMVFYRDPANATKFYFHMLALLYHSTIAFGSINNETDLSPDEASFVAMVVGARAALLLDKGDNYVGALLQQLPPDWQAVYRSEVERGRNEAHTMERSRE